MGELAKDIGARAALMARGYRLLKLGGLRPSRTWQLGPTGRPIVLRTRIGPAGADTGFAKHGFLRIVAPKRNYRPLRLIVLMGNFSSSARAFRKMQCFANSCHWLMSGNHAPHSVA